MRKTETEYSIQGNYAGGWEEATVETNWKDARAQVKAYRENDPSHAYRIRRHRVPTEEWKAEARAILQRAGVTAPYNADFHTLRSEQVDVIVSAAQMHRYRKPKNANGSTGRCFYALLQRRARRDE